MHHNMEHPGSCITFTVDNAVKFCPLYAAAPETAAERDRLREVNAKLLEGAKLAIQWADELGNTPNWMPTRIYNIIQASIATATTPEAR